MCISSHNVRLLSGGYLYETPAKVKFYGKTDNDKSIVIFDKNFTPYYHIIEPSDESFEMASEDESYVSSEDVKLKIGMEIRDAKKITVKAPWMIPKIKEKIRKSKGFVTDADIPFHLRYLWNNDIGGCTTVVGKEDEDLAKLLNVDIAISEVKEWSECDPFTPNMLVMSFDIESALTNDEIFVIGIVYGYLNDGDNYEEHYIVGNDNKEIIQKFEEFIDDIDPDIICGHNISDYDLPELANRYKKFKKKTLRIGRSFSQSRSHSYGLGFKKTTHWITDGRVVIDSRLAARKLMKPKRETLNFISNELKLGQKKPIEIYKLESIWLTDRKKVIEYCIHDAYLSYKIILDLRAIQRDLDLAAVSKLPLNEITSRTSMLVDSILIRQAYKEGYAIPTNRFGITPDRKILGGYVHNITAGLYPNVVILDFKSMYPSMIMNYNICFTTLSEDGEIESPCGAKFVRKEELEGILPRIMKKMMDDRQKAKDDMVNFPELKDYYDGLQVAIKVLMNSFYGVITSPFYRFTNPMIGESITTFARKHIKEVIRVLEEMDHDIIYSDTDSVFVGTPEWRGETTEDAISFGKELEDKFSGGILELEFEKLVHPLFSHGKKKRYVGKVVWPKEKLMIKGYETRRTDSLDISNEIMMKMFEKLMSWDEEGAIDIAKESMKEMISGNIDDSKLIMSKSVRGLTTKEYKDPMSQAHVRAALKFKEKGGTFINGMRMSYVVTKGSAPLVVEPIMENEDIPKPDYVYYARRVAKVIGRITEPFGIDDKTLIETAIKDSNSNTKQSFLLSFDKRS